jgi:hypothetical protein
VARSSRRGYGVPVALASPRVCCSTTHALKAHPPILRRRRRLLASPSRVPSHARADSTFARRRRSNVEIWRDGARRWIRTRARANETTTTSAFDEDLNEISKRHATDDRRLTLTPRA